MRVALAAVLVFLVLPVAWETARYLLRDRRRSWRDADRSSAGLLPASSERRAVVRVLAARTVSWRGIVASHCWIVLKGADDHRYRRFDYTAWGEPIAVDRFVPDGRWFGSMPEVTFAADGAAAEAMIPDILAAVRTYRYARHGDYRAWPGPNSNTFVAAVTASVPAIAAALPATAIGKDFPVDGRWFGRTPSGTGLRLNVAGYAGVTVGWAVGLEVNVLGAVWGVDLRRPALKLPAVGRIGVSR